MKVFIESLLRFPFIAILLVVPSFAFVAESGEGEGRKWTVSDSIDEISGDISVYAISYEVSPTRKMKFPYHEVEAWLGVGCNNKGEKWAYVGFTDINSPAKTLRARWDNMQTTHNISVSDTDNVHFHDDARAAYLMNKSSNLAIGIDWYGEGEVFFKWNLAGAPEAIDSALTRCGVELISDSDSEYLLRSFARDGDADAIKRLLSAGANPNATNDLGWTALMSAAGGGHADVVEMLLASGANLEAKSEHSSNTALIIAAHKKHPKIVKILLAAGANPNAAKDNGWTALMAAAYKDQPEIVQMLLAADANPNAASEGITALDIAKEKGHAEVIRVLEEAGAQ